MPSIKDLKKRIGSVKNTQQTTKAMKMVSAAKLRRAQDAILSNRPFARRIGALTEAMLSHPEITVASPLLDRDGATEAKEGKRLLLVLVTSDRGLCGGFNSNVIRAGSRFLRENSSKYASITLGFLGKKAYDFFKTKSVNMGPYFTEFGGKPTFKKAADLSNKIAQMFLDGEFDEVKVIFNEFKNAAAQQVIVDNFLPLRPALSKDGDESATSNMLVKPNPNEVLKSLLDKHFAIQMFRVMLDSQAGEHGARMSAMENATKNAGEMIRKLSLQYNKQRQAGITKELLEIIAGSESAGAA